MDNPFAQFRPTGRTDAQVETRNPFARFAPAAPLATARTFLRDEDEALYRQRLSEAQAAEGRPRIPMEGQDVNVINRPQSPEVLRQRAIEATQYQRGNEAEQAAFEASRTPLSRVGGTAAFLASVPVRAVTSGKYGAGDVAEFVSPSVASSLREGEADFARANQTSLEYLQRVGEFALGVPPLASMGAVAGGIAASGAAMANKPVPPRAIQRAQIRDERLGDVEAFRRSGVAPFGPALTETGTAAVVKQLSEAPIVGAPVRNALVNAIEGVRDAGERVAAQYGSARSYRDSGNIVQQGLDRFKNARSADVLDNTAARMTDDEIAKVANTPVRDTSLKTKQDALYERAWRLIPEDMAAGRSKKGRKRFHGGMNRTRAYLNELTDRNLGMISRTRGNVDVSPREAYPLKGGLPGQIVADIIEGRWRGSLQNMRNIRSEFRRLASGISDTERNTLKLSDMRRLQSTMTQDMIELLQRNAYDYGRRGDIVTAQRVQKSIQEFRRADKFTRAAAARLDSLEKLYGAQSAEQLGLGILRDAMGGRKGGNLRRLQQLRSTLTADEWNDVASGVIRELGKPFGSARGAAEQAGFSVSSFITNWNNMSPEGKAVLFRINKGTAELGQALDDFVRVADRMANFEALANTSRSATNGLGIAGLISIITAASQAAMGNLQAAGMAASVGAGMYGFGKLLTSPLYVKWLTRAVELSQDSRQFGSLRTHARALARIAETEPDPAVGQLVRSIGVSLDQQLEALAQNREARGRAPSGQLAFPQ